MGPTEDCYIGPMPLSWVFNPILYYLSPKIVICQEPLTVDLQQVPLDLAHLEP